MAIFHSHIQVISRGKGKSAVSAAAYRSGQLLRSEYDGTIHDYTRKGGVVHTEIFLPTNAPSKYADRSTLWNAVEKIEKAKNAQLAREIEIALPVELTLEQNLALVRRYVTENFVNAGMVADACVHVKKTENPHVHIMLTMRPFNADGTWSDKAHKVDGKKVCTTDWNERSKATEWRENWARLCNETLAANGYDVRIDHRSYAEQGVEQIPTVHLGAAATQMERKGISTDRYDINREIIMTNSQLRQLRARINKTKVWLDENEVNTPPTLAEILNSILNPIPNPIPNQIPNLNTERTRYKVIADLKLAARALAFIQENHISDLPALADKVSDMRHAYNDTYDEIKKVERRLKTLDKHVEMCANFNKYHGVSVEYDRLLAAANIAENESGLFAKSKAEKAQAAARDFYNTHVAELTIYNNAEKYLRDVLQKRFDPKQVSAQMKTWEAERGTKESDHRNLYVKCRQLEADVKDAETIKRFAVKLMFPDEQTERQRQPQQQYQHQKYR